MKDLAIIILSYNTRKLTKECIESVVAHTSDIKYELIVVDNNSTDGSVQQLQKLAKKHKTVTLRESNKNLGFAGGNNLGLTYQNARYVLFLNSDTKVESNVLGEMVQWMDAHKDVGMASCALRNADGSMQGTGGYFPTLTRVFSWMTIQDLPFVDTFIKPFHPMKAKLAQGKGFYEKEQELDWLTGAFMLIRREVLEKIKGFDEDFFMYTEDVDLCFRAKNHGYKIVYTPRWSITHYGGASSSVGYSVIKEFEGIKLFYYKHYGATSRLMLRVFLKIGALARLVVFGLIEGRQAAKIYAEAFKIA